MEVDISEEAGLFEVVYGACDQAIRYAEQADKKICEELVDRAIKLKSKFS